MGQLSIVRQFEPGTRVHDGVRLLRERGATIRIWTPEQARERFPQFAYLDGDACVFDAWAGYIAAAGPSTAWPSWPLGRAWRSTRRPRSWRCTTPVRRAPGGRRRGRSRLRSGRRRGRRVDGAAATRDGPVDQAHAATDGVLHAPRPRRLRPRVMPVWGADPDETGWYGHPLLAEGFVKVADDLLGERVDPDTHRDAPPEFIALAREFVAQRIPGLAGAAVAGSRSCLYENTPDRDFIVDWVPGSSRVLGGRRRQRPRLQFRRLHRARDRRRARGPGERPRRPVQTGRPVRRWRPVSPIPVVAVGYSNPVSQAATRSSSWSTPPRRSRRQTGPSSRDGEAAGRGAGAARGHGAGGLGCSVRRIPGAPAAGGALRGSAPIEALPAHCPYPALSEGIGPWRPAAACGATRTPSAAC